MILGAGPDYQQLVTKAQSSHEQGRSALSITEDDIARARLYCYAFRNHSIGAYHATRQAVLKLEPSGPLRCAHQHRAAETLEDLANMGMEVVPRDFRVVIATFHRYDRLVCRAIDALQQVEAGEVTDRFYEFMSTIATSGGITPTQDTAAPQQAGCVVPNLGITIIPLVYGDHHSWNLAWLSQEHLDVPWHRHHQGVEIHLGYEPLEGCMILGEYKSPVNEGYALPILPKTRHGWANLSGRVHHVPFIFGSLKQAGWGVFLDVEAQPMPLEQFRQVERDSWQMSHTVFLQRQIKRLTSLRGQMRQTIVPASVMDREGVGGLELSLTRINETGYTYPIDDFRAVSVVNGRGRLRIGPAQCGVSHHDHFGVPAGMSATLHQEGDDSLVLLDALIKTVASSRES